MEAIFTSVDNGHDFDNDFGNIISINDNDASDDDLMDYDFDYDPNDMYYELLNS